MIKLKFVSLSRVLIPACALTLALLTASPPAKAAVAVATTYTDVGTAGNYEGNCANPQCDTPSGCRSTTNIFDNWFKGKSCTGGGAAQGTNGTCSEDYKLCRKIVHYPRTNCTGPVQSIEITNRTMCAGGETPRFPDPPVTSPD